MEIRSATALHDDYDGVVCLSKEKQSPFFKHAMGMEKWLSCPSSYGKSGRQSLNRYPDGFDAERSMIPLSGNLQ